MTRYPDIDLFLTRNLTNNDIFVKSEEDSVSQNIKNLSDIFLLTEPPPSLNSKVKMYSFFMPMHYFTLVFQIKKFD